MTVDNLVSIDANNLVSVFSYKCPVRFAVFLNDFWKLSIEAHFLAFFPPWNLLLLLSIVDSEGPWPTISFSKFFLVLSSLFFHECWIRESSRRPVKNKIQ